MVLKLTKTDIAFVKGQKKMMDSFQKRLDKELEKIEAAKVAADDWKNKIESLNNVTVGLYGKTVDEIISTITVEEQPPLIVQDKSTGDYVPNPVAVGEDIIEEKVEEAAEPAVEQIQENEPAVAEETEETETEEETVEEKEEEIEEKLEETVEAPWVTDDDDLEWSDETEEENEETEKSEPEHEEEHKDPMEDSEWPELPDYPEEWNN